MRVCQFRHDGKWTSIVAAAEGCRIRKTCVSILQACCVVSNHHANPHWLNDPLPLIVCPLREAIASTTDSFDNR